MTKTYTDTEIERCLRSGEDAETLRSFFGPALYEAMREEATVPPAAFSGRGRPKVYVLPGILGSKLKARNWLSFDLVWIDLIELAFGGVRRLRLSPDDGVRPAGLVRLAYQMMKLRLRRLGLDVEELPFDWRKSTASEAARLIARLRNDNASGVTLVGHSMGGLVARGMAGLDPDGELIGRVITIGTPNLGSYAPVQVFTLDHGLLGEFAKADVIHDEAALVTEYMRHFPGLAEMMPSFGHGPFDFFDRTAWPNQQTVPRQAVLSEAFAGKTDLPAPDGRFTQIISVGENTVVDAQLADNRIEYITSDDGDGTVPRVMAEMGQVQRYYTHGSHPWLCNQTYIIDAVRDLVLTGQISDRTNFSSDPARAKALAVIPELSVLEGREVDELPGEAKFLNSFGATPISRTFATPRRAVIAELDLPHGEDVIGPRGYVLDHMVEAGEAWRDAASDRAEIDRHVEQGTSTLAETPERLEKYERRIMDALSEDAPVVLRTVGQTELEATADTLSSIDDLRRERIIGGAEEFLSVDFLKRGGLALNPVCRIVFLAGTQGYGTGFLVAPDVVLTNNHVLPNVGVAHRSGAQFEYERSARRRDLNGHVFELDPDRLFLTNKRLDFTFVALKKSASAPHRAYGYLPLIGEEGKIRLTRPVNIIQHPDARRKEVIVRESVLKIFPPTRMDFAHYTGDTLPGSSGSPVLNDRWEVVALHHSGVPDTDASGRVLKQDGTLWSRAQDPRGETIKWVANEGVRISRIIPKVEEARQDPARPTVHREMLKTVLDVGTRANSEGAFFWLDGTMPSGTGPRHSVRESFDSESAVAEPCPDTRCTSASAAHGSDIILPMASTVNLMPSETSDIVVSVDAPVEERWRITDYDDRRGYDPEFLGVPVAFPQPTDRIRYDAATLSGSSENELKYDTFSVIMSRSRRLAFVSGGNYDPDAPYHAERRDPWGYDPRLPRSLQAGNRHYRRNPLDRGHLFRAGEGAWGDSHDAAQRASDDTFHWTNIAPQHEVFNQSGRDRVLSVWGQIENHLMNQARANGGRRMTTFNGPVLKPDDPDYQGLQIPRSFWKVAVLRDGDALQALAFVLSQETLLDRLETLRAGRFGVYQVPLSEIEALTDLDFGDLHNADPFGEQGAHESLSAPGLLLPIENVWDIRR